MLNPECVDYNNGRVKLLFTDQEGDEVIKIYLSEDDAWQLSEQIRHKCNWPAKKKRSYSDEIFDHTF